MHQPARKITRQIVLTAAVALLGACGKGDDDMAADSAASGMTGMAAAPMAAEAPASGAATGAVTDPQIAAIVVAANTVDIEAGQLAQSKSSSAQVKEFAAQMVRDHGAVNKQATDLVTRLNVTPEPNATAQSLTDGGRTNLDSLRTKSGADFDRAYIANEVAYHQAVLDAIDKTLIPNAQNAELRTLLEQTRPNIAAHLEHARRVQTSM